MAEMKTLTVNGIEYEVTDAKAVRTDAQVLDTARQAQARANIGAAGAEALGDIEAVLDGILAIQQALMGGDGS